MICWRGPKSSQPSLGRPTLHRMTSERSRLIILLVDNMQTRLFRTPAALALVTLAAAGACTPEVEYRSSDVDSVSWEEVRGHVELDVTNGWPAEIRLARYRYSLSVANVEVAEASSSVAQTIGARAQTTVSVPFTVSFQRVLDSAVSLVTTAKAPFALAGDATFDTPFGEVEVPANVGGTIPVLQRPELSLPALKLTEWSLISGTFDLDINVSISNPNALSIDFDDVKYELEFQGERLVSGYPDSIEIKANVDSPLRLPVHVDIYAIGRGLWTAVKSGALDGSMVLGAAVRTPWNTIPYEYRRSGSFRVFE